jgi:hypothetical protein
MYRIISNVADRGSAQPVRFAAQVEANHPILFDWSSQAAAPDGALKDYSCARPWNLVFQLL